MGFVNTEHFECFVSILIWFGGLLKTYLEFRQILVWRFIPFQRNIFKLWQCGSNIEKKWIHSSHTKQKKSIHIITLFKELIESENHPPSSLIMIIINLFSKQKRKEKNRKDKISVTCCVIFLPLFHKAIRIIIKNVHTTGHLFSLQFFELAYENATLQPHANSVNCDFDNLPPADRVCRVNLSHFGKCTASNSYGYNTSKPCIFIKLNKVSVGLESYFFLCKYWKCSLNHIYLL